MSRNRIGGDHSSLRQNQIFSRLRAVDILRSPLCRLLHTNPSTPASPWTAREERKRQAVRGTRLASGPADQWDQHAAHAAKFSPRCFFPRSFLAYISFFYAGLNHGDWGVEKEPLACPVVRPPPKAKAMCLNPTNPSRAPGTTHTRKSLLHDSAARWGAVVEPRDGQRAGSSGL
jgi:hypothetical protein